MTNVYLDFVDQCKPCMLRGDMKACIITDCGIKSSWYAKALKNKMDIATRTFDETEEFDND
jgi:hypothetical protein